MILQGTKEDVLISYITLRRAIGILGILFPIVLVFGSFSFNGFGALPVCKEIQPSISSYYHTNMRDVFVGTLCTIALVFFAYRSENDWRDNVFGNLACFFTLGVAFLPTSVSDETSCISSIDNDLIGTIHLISAALLFLVLAYFSLVLFVKDTTRNANKLIYRICGSIMLLCVFFIGIYFIFLDKTNFKNYNLVFWGECFALWAFGISWLVKGELLWKDIV